MSNPYTSPTLSGYNTSPPADDGTTGAANISKWVTHTAQIGGPLKTYLDAIKANLSTAFGLQALNTVSSKSDNYTVLTSDQGALLVQTGANKTFTLPAAASAGANFVVTFLHLGGDTCIIDGATSETIDGATTKVLAIYRQWVTLACDGSEWRILAQGGIAPTQTAVLASDFVHSDPLSTNYETITGFSFTGQIQDDHRFRLKAVLEVEGGAGAADVWVQVVTSNVTAISWTLVTARHTNLTGASWDFVRNIANSRRVEIPDNKMPGTLFLEMEANITTVTGAPTIIVQIRNEFADTDPPTVKAGSFVTITEMLNAHE
jgi:hypothetical protein